MAGYIERITGTIPYTNKEVDIPLDGKNLIITGANGSGKTSLLKTIYEETNLLIKEFNILGSDNKNLKIDIPNINQYSIDYKKGKAVRIYFDDRHFSKITPAIAATGLSESKEKAKQELQQQQNLYTENHNIINKFGNNLEQHLLNLKSRRSFAITEDKNQALADNIDVWFTGFEKNLKKLFEDDSAKLVFNSNKNKFSIQQDNKPPYTFQTLSAGYKAIFDIYADLLMRTEYFEVMPNELEGVVFIDEIDSHLHVSLQRIILPFFAESFPKIQFIITTHSPFVLMSTKDNLVLDLSKDEPYQISQAKSQNEVLNEYLGVPTAMPIWAEKSLENILNKYLTVEADKVSFAEMKKELKDAGLEEYFPDSMAKVLEANQ